MFYHASLVNYEYDSTNMMTKTWRAQSHEMTIGHDGVGREGKRSHRSWDSEEEEWGDWETRYFVHSSVLGQTLSEISQTGTKVRTFVVAAGTVVARQFYDSGSNEAVSWELADASGQSIRMANATGGYTDVDSGGAELDALGNNVGTHGSLSDPRNSEGEVSPANRSPISAEALCDKGGFSGPCWLVNLLNNGSGYGLDQTGLPREMTGSSAPGSNERHPFYFAFYRNSLEAAEDDGRWFQGDWEYSYAENLSGTNDSSVTIIGRVNAMTFIPGISSPVPISPIAKMPTNEKLAKCLSQFGAGTSLLSLKADGTELVATIGMNGRSFQVTTHTNRFTAAELGRLEANQKRIKYTGWSQSGFTTGNNPTSNDIASEVPIGVFTGKYKMIGLIALYYHELGNAIAGKVHSDAYVKARTSEERQKLQDPFNLNIPKTAQGDTDSGVRFERCLFGGIVSLQTGRVGNTRQF